MDGREKKMRSRKQWIFTEEWDDGCKENVTAYGNRNEREIEEICSQMERYSPYDYCVPCIFGTEQEYLRALDARVKNQCKITYY